MTQRLLIPTIDGGVELPDPPLPEEQLYLAALAIDEAATAVVSEVAQMLVEEP